MPLRDWRAEEEAKLPATPYGTPSAAFPQGRLRYPMLKTRHTWQRESAADRSMGDHTRKIKPMPPRKHPTDPRMRFAVYRFFTIDNKLLYVGKAADPFNRYESHQRSRQCTWWHRVHHDAPLEWFRTEAEALYRETQIMATEHPIANNGGIWIEHRYDAKGVCPCGLKIT